MMLSSFLRTWLVPVFVLAGSFLSGCIATTTTTTKLYVLNPLDSGASLVSKADQKDSLSIEIASLRLPQYLERPQIVTRSGENRLELGEYHRWGENLKKNMVRVLSKNLSQLLATPNIAIAPHHPPTSPDFRVELEVMQFERNSDGHVRLTARWLISRGKDRQPLVTQITDLASPVVHTGPDYALTVAAMNTLFGELSQIIGQEILKQVHERSVP
jgi:uncharacterized lipoprotein YmbA